jgi:hypothetical protein
MNIHNEINKLIILRIPYLPSIVLQIIQLLHHRLQAFRQTSDKLRILSVTEFVL